MVVKVEGGAFYLRLLLPKAAARTPGLIDD